MRRARFCSAGISAGQSRPVMVNGGTVTGTTLRYPAVAEPIDIVANQANVVPYTFYLPPIDTVNEVTVVPNQQTIVTTPDAPGFKQMIPANAGLKQSGRFAGDTHVGDVRGYGSHARAAAFASRRHECGFHLAARRRAPNAGNDDSRDLSQSGRTQPRHAGGVV